MYSKDIRARVSAYDRMRTDQERVNVLTAKARELKARNKLLKARNMKNSASGVLQHSNDDNFRGTSTSPSRKRAKSPVKMSSGIKYLDPKLYQWVFVHLHDQKLIFMISDLFCSSKAMKEILGLADESNLKLKFDSNFDDDHIQHSSSHSHSLKRPLNDPYIPRGGSPSPRRQSAAHSPRRSFTASNNASIRASSVNFRDSSARDHSVGRAHTKATMNASQLVYNAHFSGLEVWTHFSQH